MCVSVFPDSSGLTLEGLKHIGNLQYLKSLTLHGMSANVANGQGQTDPWGWARGLLSREEMRRLEISGEL